MTRLEAAIAAMIKATPHFAERSDTHHVMDRGAAHLPDGLITMPVSSNGVRALRRRRLFGGRRLTLFRSARCEFRSKPCLQDIASALYQPESSTHLN
jgi:hypothetical protein